MYEINSAANYDSLCVGGALSQLCIRCDSLLFRAVPNGANFDCVPHEYSNEVLFSYGIPAFYTFGYANNVASWWNFQTPLIFGPLPPHFAVRLRFSVHLINWGRDVYMYPLDYSMDGKTYLYNQTLDKYWSPYDIVTSPLQTHTDSQVTVSFALLDSSLPYNTGCNAWARDGVCSCWLAACWACCASCCPGCCGWGCCDAKYIQVRDYMLFVSVCPTGCLNCTSASACIMCDTSLGALGYYINKADKTCYLTCPQTTYQDIVTTFTTSATTTAIIEYVCSPCPITCLWCTSATVCTICFAYGKNESFLYKGSCINPCIDGFQGNYSTHICVCPIQYYYIDPVTLLCTSCAIECVTCTGATNLDCSYCELGYYLAYQTSHCLVECPVGQYKNDWKRIC